MQKEQFLFCRKLQAICDSGLASFINMTSLRATVPTPAVKMELFSKQSECIYIFPRLTLGDNTLKTHNNWVKVVGFKASSHATVRRWHTLFVSFREQEQENCHPSQSTKDSLNRGKSVCSRRECEGRPTYLKWEISLSPVNQEGLYQGWERLSWRDIRLKESTRQK